MCRTSQRCSLVMTVLVLLCAPSYARRIPPPSPTRSHARRIRLKDFMAPFPTRLPTLSPTHAPPAIPTSNPVPLPRMSRRWADVVTGTFPNESTSSPPHSSTVGAGAGAGGAGAGLPAGSAPGCLRHPRLLHPGSVGLRRVHLACCTVGPIVEMFWSRGVPSVSSYGQLRSFVLPSSPV